MFALVPWHNVQNLPCPTRVVARQWFGRGTVVRAGNGTGRGGVNSGHRRVA